MTTNSTSQNAVPDHRDATGGRKLGRNTVVYGAGVVAQRLASAIMLPVYTRLLAPADYGLLAMLSITVDIAVIFVSAGMTAGVMRYYFKAESETDRNRVLTSAVAVLLALNLVGTVLLALLAPWVWRLVLDSRGAVWYVWIAAANLTIGSLSAVPLLYMQMRGYALRYSITQLVLVLSGLVLNIILLVLFRLGPVAILISAGVSGLLVGGSALVWMLRQTGTSISRASMRDLRRFGVPYQFVTAGTFLLTYGDRFFLKAADGLSAVGQYSLAYQFGFLFMGLGPMPFYKAWTPVRHQQLQLSRAERDAHTNTALRFFTLLVSLLAVGIAVFAAPGLRIVATAEYQLAADLIPLIVGAYLLLGWTDVMQFGIDVSERTSAATYATWITVAAILLLQFLLIPRYGVSGAAAATVVAFGLRFALYTRAAQRLTPISYDWRVPLTSLVLAVLAVLGERLLRPASIVAQLALSATIWLAFGVGVALLVLRREDRRAVADALSAPRRRVTLFFSASSSRPSDLDERSETHDH